MTYGYVGVAEFEHQGEQSDETPNLTILSTIDAKPQQVGYHLLKGRWANNDHEIAVSQKTLTDSNYQLGDWLNIKVGQVTHGEVVDDPGDEDGSGSTTHSAEKIVKSHPVRYRITGIIEQPSSGYHYYGLTAKAAVKRTNAYLILKQPRHYRRDISEILGLTSYRQVQELKQSQYFYGVNANLLHWQVFAFSDTNVQSLIAVATVIVAIILLTSIFCIRNSFAISTTEKIKMYGMLASVGATKQQIRQIVLRESFILASLGIPAGLMLGSLAAWILAQVVNQLGSQIIFDLNHGFHFVFSWWGLIIAAVLGGLTIYLSALSSVRQASRVSPIDQLQNRQAVTLKAEKLKTPKWIKHIFKMGGVIAYKNLRRSSKKYRTTVISIAVSITTFITMTAFINTVFAATDDLYQERDYNLAAYFFYQSIKPEQLTKIVNLPTIKKAHQVSVIAQEEPLRIHDQQHLNSANANAKNESEFMEIEAVDHQSFQQLLKNSKIQNTSTVGSLLFDYSNIRQNQTPQRIYDYQAGDQISGKIHYQGKNRPISIKLGGLLSELPNWIFSHSSGNLLILDQAKYPQLAGIKWTPSQLLLQSIQKKQTIETIKKIAPNISIEDIDAQMREARATKMLFSIFLYGFILVIVLIGLTNIFNTITANMVLRQREFAILKSVGMTQHEFNQLINLETLFYCAKSLLWGIGGGLVGSLLLYLAFNGNTATPVTYVLPWQAILIATISVFVLIFLIMRYSLNKINRQNIIETIRRENI